MAASARRRNLTPPARATHSARTQGEEQAQQERKVGPVGSNTLELHIWRRQQLFGNIRRQHGIAPAD
jgi:hypothetical protein